MRWLGHVVTALSDSAGEVTDRYAYDPYGNNISGTGDAGYPYRYTGRRHDAQTGLYYYRARYYDPRTGKFLQTDPIGTADQMNLYTYVANDPLNATDPTGEQAVTDEERQFVNEGDLNSYWQSRDDRGDPVGDLGVEYGKPVGERSTMANDSDMMLRAAVFSKYNDVENPDTGGTDWPQIADLMSDEIAGYRQDLAEGHIRMVDTDTSGVPNFLSLDQTVDYHHDALNARDIPTWGFAGTPIFGQDWEGAVTNTLTGWCNGCDKK